MRTVTAPRAIFFARLALALSAVLAAAPPARPARAAARLAGNVWTVDAENGLVTIVDAGRRLSFTYDAETIIRRGSSDRSIDDLRRGDRIVVSLAEGEPPHARLIAIAGPAVPSRALRLP